jgi:metal-sulfur cluster biosynthetic enzyme
MQKKQMARRKAVTEMRMGNGSDPAPMLEKAIAGLRCVIDPHTNINVYDMRLISDLEANDEVITMTFRPTSPFCPLAFDLARSMIGEMWELDGPRVVRVTVVGHYQEDNINKALKALAPKRKKKSVKKARKK